MTTRRQFFSGIGSLVVLRALPIQPTQATKYGIEIIPRAEWAVDRPPLDELPSEDVRFLLVHHSASSNGYSESSVVGILQGFYDFHTSAEKGWPDIAYNFLIDRYGRIWEGRTGSIDGAVAADATGGNQGSSQLACLIGDFTEELPTEAALIALTRLLGWMADRFGVSTEQGATVTFTSRGSNRWPAGVEVTTPTIAGHRDMSLTSCPGDALYPYILGGLSEDVESWRLSLAAPDLVEPATPPVSTSATTTSAVTPVTVVSSLPRPTISAEFGAPEIESQGLRTWARGAIAAGLLGGLALLLRRLSKATTSRGDEI
ncbi:MAG TPA: N-acetylmuramoyl-L-alanine amidase [Acidimicrobiia bacterium]|nr:N-acetylmuramoyl-L-alanine amidase [Acidimicrobiia bacterium]